MLYYLGIALRDVFQPFNVLTYHTVRAGGAVVTGFVFALLMGPTIISWLRYLKVGQFIREQHVADLHALHKKKAGTPTMGGAIILLGTVITLLFWGRPTNRLLIVSMIVLITLGLVGFLDDYVKMRRKKNEGLSARAKFAGQILTGLFLGLYLFLYPVTQDGIHVHQSDILDLDRAVHILQNDLQVYMPNPPAIPSFPESERSIRDEVVHSLNTLIAQNDFTMMGITVHETEKDHEYDALVELGDRRTEHERQRLNRILLSIAYPQVFARSVGDVHAKLEVPFLKYVFIPLGFIYILFVILIIVSASNAVNLTDGLDGLAIGASIISIMAYTAIAYIISRADWSRYLFLVHVPEAAELTVFGAALLGTGLGFLWYNCHPAEVFMGDTGSLALGGAIGTMAILTKQELLLILVGGLFVMEAGSVVLQVASFKLRGKRVFRMAPLHHHFELKGWSETKVVMRFWIIALLFALMSLGALKLR